MNIHKILQIVLQRFPSLPSPSICALDAFGLPVCPVDSLAIKSKSKGVRQIAPNQHLVRLPPAPQKNITKSSLRGKRLPLPPLDFIVHSHSKRKVIGQHQPSKECSLTPSLQLKGSSSLPMKAAQCVLIWRFHFQLEREAGAISTLCSRTYTSGSQTPFSKMASLPSCCFHPDWHTRWSSCLRLPSTSAVTHSQ